MYTSSLGAPAMDVGKADGLIRCSLFSKVTGNIGRFGQTSAAAHAGMAPLSVTLLSAELAKDPVSTCKGISILVSERYELEMNCHGAFLILLVRRMELQAAVRPQCSRSRESHFSISVQIAKHSAVPTLVTAASTIP